MQMQLAQKNVNTFVNQLMHNSKPSLIYYKANNIQQPNRTGNDSLLKAHDGFVCEPTEKTHAEILIRQSEQHIDRSEVHCCRANRALLLRNSAESSHYSTARIHAAV